MRYRNMKSEYDKCFERILKGSKTLIVDLDGTIINFEKIDNIIIEQLFPNNKFIVLIDDILWKINKLDLIGNGYAALKLRLWFYSLISKKNFKDAKASYGEMYAKLAKIEFDSIYSSVFRDIINSGYKIVVATKNVYAKDILNKTNALGIPTADDNVKLMVLRRNKKHQFKKLIAQNDGWVCVIGNNFADDILNSCRIGAPFIYIGQSKATKGIIRWINFTGRIFCHIYKRGIQCENIKNLKRFFVSDN